MSSSKTLHLAVELDSDGERTSPRALAEVVADAERAGYTFATFDDAPVPPAGGFRVDATVRAAYSATRTSRIGLAPTSHVLTAEPFHLAAQLASLDHATHGRAAWIVGAAATPEALATVGRAEPDDLRHEVADVVEAVRRLWDSWEDDAVVKDLATGRYLDPDKVHHVDFTGETFSVKGPLITPRPPQGSLVVLAAEEFADDVRPDIVLTDDLQRSRPAEAPLLFGELEVRFDSAAPAPKGRARYTGSPAGLVTVLEQLGLDGVRLHPGAADLPLLSREVLPELRRRGLHAPPEPGATLRTTLGLPRPENRFAGSSKGIA
ncbi:LLM class flavin-dependent oxidoreductase [Amycolatopsis rubida]|uniref:Luciferase-like monooxygenase n=1 Tax=Amycolatopsis rubida TaxID=112413 RepID=A0A1I5LGF2_9PSEU|nr:LLM class flavin-dependent oxidoreductase [Amycolatopsis rubida]SFO96380.1 Luciferase-like monooxygenase [Amycolatopsis rubida]